MALPDNQYGVSRAGPLPPPSDGSWGWLGGAADAVGRFLGSAIHGNQLDIPTINTSGHPTGTRGPTGPRYWIPKGVEGIYGTGKAPAKVVPKKKPPKKTPPAAPVVVDPPPTAVINTGLTNNGNQTVTTDPPPAYAPFDQKWFEAKVAQAMGPSATPAQVRKAASKLAAMAVQALVSPILTQQQQLQQQGRQQALNIFAASRAAGNLQNNFGAQLGKLYTGAADETQQIAQGYTGDLKAQALADQSQLAQQVAAAGGPAMATGPAGTINNAADAFYAAHGAAPATSLGAGSIGTGTVLQPQFPGQAGVAMMAAQALPHLVRGAGLQGGLLAEGAANQASNALFKNIEDAKAQLPRLTQSYINTLTSQEAASQKNRMAGLSLAMDAYFKGRTADLNAWVAQQNANIKTGQLTLGQNKYTQTGQIAQATADLNSYKAYTDRKSKYMAASTARIRANTAAANASKGSNSQARLVRKDQLAVRKALANDVSNFVFGVMSSPSVVNGQLTQTLTSDPMTPIDAYRKLVAMYGGVISPQVIAQELAFAYGGRRIVHTPEEKGGVGVLVGWPKNIKDLGLYMAFPTKSDGSTVYTETPSG